MKRGQMQIQESILVIFIFFVILMIVLVMFFQFQKKSILNDIEEYQEMEFKQLIDVIPNMAELKYSKLGIEKGCIDYLKAKAFRGMNYDFGNKMIVLKYNGDLVLYDHGEGDLRKVSSPVCVYDARSKKFYFGELEVGWYR